MITVTERSPSNTRPPGALRTASPSVELVYWALRHDGPQTQTELMDSPDQLSWETYEELYVRTYRPRNLETFRVEWSASIPKRLS